MKIENVTYTIEDIESFRERIYSEYYDLSCKIEANEYEQDEEEYKEIDMERCSQLHEMIEYIDNCLLK